MTRTFNSIEPGSTKLTIGNFDAVTAQALRFLVPCVGSSQAQGASPDMLVSASPATKKAYAAGIYRAFEGNHFGGMSYSNVLTSQICQEVFAGIHKESPAGARQALAACKFVWKWAVMDGSISADAPNPFTGVVLPKASSKEYRPWPVEMIDAIINFEDNLFASTAVMIAYDTGQRIGDISQLKFENFQVGEPPFDDIVLLRMKQEKTGQLITMRCTPRLASRIMDLRSIARTSLENPSHAWRNLENLNVLKTAAGAISSSEYDTTTITRACQAVLKKTLPNYAWIPFHGLRKSATIRLVDAGATEAEVMAITGHKTSAMANHYGKLFSREKAAMRAIDKINSNGK